MKPVFNPFTGEFDWIIVETDPVFSAWLATFTPQNLSLGATTQIPYMNAAGTDFLYSANFRYENGTLKLDSNAKNAINTSRTVIDQTDSINFLLNEKVQGSGRTSSCLSFTLDDERVLSGTGLDDSAVMSNYWMGRVNKRLIQLSAANVSILRYNLYDSGKYNYTAGDTAVGTTISSSMLMTNYKVEIGTNTLTNTNTGYLMNLVTPGPSIISGTLIVNTRLFWAKGLGHTVGTHTLYDFYSDVTGADTHYCFYNVGSGHNLLGKDNAKTYFGTGIDASIYYDGTNLCINPKEVGSGVIDIKQAPGTAPVSTTPVAWHDIKINGTAYKMALYQ